MAQRTGQPFHPTLSLTLLKILLPRNVPGDPTLVQRLGFDLFGWAGDEWRWRESRHRKLPSILKGRLGQVYDVMCVR